MATECILCGSKGPSGLDQIGTRTKLRSQKRTLMQWIIKCVPIMENVITANDLICRICKTQLMAAVKFYEKCSEALTKLEARKNSIMTNLNSSLGDPIVSGNQDSQTAESFSCELGIESFNIKQEQDGTNEEMETVCSALEEQYSLTRKSPLETNNLELATDTTHLSNFEESSPYEFVPVFETHLKQEQDITNDNFSTENRITSIDRDVPIEIPKISVLSLQEAWENEHLPQQVSFDKSIVKMEEINWFTDGLISFQQPFKQWSPQENNPVFLSCSGLKDNLFKISLDLNKAGVKKVFLSPLRQSAQKRIICLGSLNVSNSLIKKESTATEVGFTCIRCSRVCDDELDYTIHYYGNHKKQCPECINFKPKSAGMLRSHYDNGHVLERYMCPKCNEMFYSKSSYDDHVDEYADTSACYFQCPQCREKFKLKKYFEAHLKSHNTPKICEICAKEFKNKIALRTHVSNVHADKILCPICGNMYSKSNLKQHMSLQHNSKRKTFMCDQCPKTYKSNHYLKMHKLEKHESGTEVPKPYCALCDKYFSFGYTIREHNDVYHNKKAKFKCETCDEQFVRKDYWKNHMKMHIKHGPNWRQTRKRGREKEEHSEPKKPKKYIGSAPVLCNICNELINASRYKTHYNKHLNYRPFKCKHCPMKFFDNPSAMKHEKLHDDPTYNLSCRICYNKFDNEDLLNEHLKKHANKLRYPCDMCDKRFGRMYLLEIHKVNDHAEEEEEKKTIIDKMLKKVVRVVPEHEIDEYTENSKISILSTEVITDEQYLATTSLAEYTENL